MGNKMDTQKDIVTFLSEFDKKIGYLDTAKLISEALQFITIKMKLKRASIAMLDPDHSGFIVREATIDKEELGKGSFLPLDSTHLSQSVQKREAIYRPDIKQYKPVFNVDARLLKSEVVCDFIVPLIVEDQCIGTLNGGSAKVDGISEHNRQLLTLIAPKLVHALRNANLYEELQESERKFKSLLNSMDDLVFVLDAENRFVSYYAPEEQLYLKPEAFMGKKVGEVMPPVVVEKFNEALVNVKQGKTAEYEYCLEMPEGKHWFSIKLSPIMENGEYAGLASVSRDITERKQAEEALHNINNRLNISIENMPNAYILLDQNLHVVEWNNAAEDIFGYSKQEMLGKNPVDYIVPKAGRHLVVDVLRKLKMGEVADYSEKDNNICKDGKLISCQWYNTPLSDDEGNVFGILLLAQDITEHKRAEEELAKHREHLEELVKERTEELEEKNNELERFNKLFVGRELRIIELKDKVKELKQKLHDK